MTLTDSDRAAIAAAWVGCDGSARSLQMCAEQSFIAGRKSGRAEAIAEAAKLCRERAVGAPPAYATEAQLCAAAIEALADA